MRFLAEIKAPLRSYITVLKQINFIEMSHLNYMILSSVLVRFVYFSLLSNLDLFMLLLAFFET